LEDWDVELDEHRNKSDLVARPGNQPPRLVHKVMFSMPAGTPPDKVLAAVQNFCREEFALKHRYVMALHTDEPHPHVHVVIKAMSEQGRRLQIRKATLREWRRGFARHLRDQGVEANATERAVRGNSHGHMLDGVYRPMHDKKKERYSTHRRKREGEVGRELLAGGSDGEPGKSRLVATRKEVERGWRAVSDILLNDGQAELAAQVRRFVEEMPPPRTDKEVLAHALAARVREGRERSKRREDLARRHVFRAELERRRPRLEGLVRAGHADAAGAYRFDLLGPRVHEGDVVPRAGEECAQVAADRACADEEDSWAHGRHHTRLRRLSAMAIIGRPWRPISSWRPRA